MTATDILLYRTLAAARQEGLPQPILASVGLSQGLYLRLKVAEDATRWIGWFTSHGAVEHWTIADTVEGSQVRHVAVSSWRGWHVQMEYLTPVGLEAGVAGD